MARRLPITKTELKLIAQELDVSRGFLPQLVMEKPWITDISRQYLCEKEELCDKFPVFRTVALMRLSIPKGETVAPHIIAQAEASKELRPETVVSTSLNPWTVLSIAGQQSDKIYFTGGMFRGGILRTEPVILRYEITLDRVILFVPALIAYIRSIYSPEELTKVRYRNRWNELHSVFHIFRELEHREENEVIADVTGLEPADVFETKSNTLIYEARDVLNPAFDPVEYLKSMNEWGYPAPPPLPDVRYVAPPPGPTPEQEKRAAYLEELHTYVHEFFATPWRDSVGDA